MIKEDIRKRIDNAKKREVEYCREMSNIEVKIEVLKRRKKRFQKMISKSVKYRNILINDLNNG